MNRWCWPPLNNRGTAWRSRSRQWPESPGGLPFVTLVKETIKQLASNPEKDRPVWLSQCYLKTGEAIGEFFHITCTGIPDLLKLSPGEGGQAIIEAGDIKRSQKPGYHHKWQVAFYALALEQIIDRHKLCARVSRKGFIITPPPLGKILETEPYQIHEFDLIPYLAALPHAPVPLWPRAFGSSGPSQLQAWASMHRLFRISRLLPPCPGP